MSKKDSSPALKENVIKVVLSTGKEVLLREMKIKFQDQAIQSASKAGGNGKEVNTIAVGAAIQKQLLKILLHSVDGEQLNGAQKEDLDNLFKFSEYSQLMKVVGKITGEDEGNAEPTMELITSGNT